MRKLLLVCFSLLTVVALLASCAQPTEAPTEAPAEPAEPEPAEPEPEAAYKAGMVTDMGGIDDKSFNTTAWKGLQMAEDELGAEVAYLESQQQADYAVNITQFLDQEYNMIVTVGFLLGDDTATFAEQNPDTHFTIVEALLDAVVRHRASPGDLLRLWVPTSERPRPTRTSARRVIRGGSLTDASGFSTHRRRPFS